LIRSHGWVPAAILGQRGKHYVKTTSDGWFGEIILAIVVKLRIEGE